MKPGLGDGLGGFQAQVEPVQTAEIDPAADFAPVTRMEDAILSEEEHPEANALDDLAGGALLQPGQRLEVPTDLVR